MESTSDVIVVGAGLSGLQAALDLHCSCRSVVVLEARDRVGGKLRTVQRPDGKGFQEFGAAWLNDTNQQHMWNYCRQFGLTPVVQNIIGAVACEDTQGKVQSVPFNTLPEVSLPLSLLPVCPKVPWEAYSQPGPLIWRSQSSLRWTTTA